VLEYLWPVELGVRMVNPLFSLAGFAVGLLVGMTGVGGGALMTPLLILLFGVSPATAVGTDLIYAAATKSAGALVHGFSRSIDFRLVGRLALGSIPASAATVFVLSRFDINGSAVRSGITLVLCFALVATAAALVFGEWIVRNYRGRLETISSERAVAGTVILGAALGVLVSVSSIGAGAIGVVALLLLYPKMPMAKIVASDIAHAVPLTLVAGMGHWALGSVDWAIILSLLFGSLPGIIAGSMIAVRIPERVLKLTMASSLLVIGSGVGYEHATTMTTAMTALTSRALH
jgi:uncharacterized membrane protein YfcA